MNLREYQEFTNETAVYPVGQDNPVIISAMYCALGLTGEAGEVAEKVKKWHRDGVVDKALLAKELGDVLWYLAQLAENLDIDLQDILNSNVQKLTSRKARNVLNGNGDIR